MGMVPSAKNNSVFLPTLSGQAKENLKHEHSPARRLTNRNRKRWRLPRLIQLCSDRLIFNNDSTITAAALDRLLHHAETVVIEGTSYRMKDQAQS